MIVPDKKYDAAIARIVTDESFLSQKCVDCVDVDNLATIAIIQDLLDTAHALEYGGKYGSCLGLAANQLGYNERIIVVKFGDTFKVFVNPEITGKGPLIQSVESCFSRRGKPGKRVQRAKSIKFKSDTGKGKFRGIEAIVFQHELDHLNGVLI